MPVKELKSILAFFNAHIENQNMALATVVRVEGSSYRRMGARMLVSENGTWVGGISGGCLEGDALKRAKVAILKDSPSIITYDTTTDDNHQIGVGLGCSGIIDVLFTPVNAHSENIRLLQKIVDGNREVHRVLTFTKSSKKEFLGQIIPLENYISYFQELTLEGHLPLLEKSKHIDLDKENAIFYELIYPSIHLVLFGYHYDIYPLIRQAVELGWQITVVAPPGKVKTNENIRLLTPEEMDNIEFDPFTAAILMSHSLETDKRNLLGLVQKSPRYIGMLGPKVRSMRIMDELGSAVPNEIKSSIYAPIGLEIGAITPEEIALSIVSEIKAVFSDKKGGHLRHRELPIHEREEPMNFN